MWIYHMFPKIYIHFEDTITNFTLNFKCFFSKVTINVYLYSRLMFPIKASVPNVFSESKAGVFLVSPFFLSPHFDAYLSQIIHI